jgi:gluconokinase
MKILVLESSTSSIKAMVYNTESKKNNVMGKKHAQQNIGQGIHNAEEIYISLLKLGAIAAKEHSINAIALSSTWHSLLLCDVNKQPVSPVYLWSNPMAGQLCQKLSENKVYAKSYHDQTGCIVNASYPYFKLRAMRQDKENDQLEDSSIQIMDQGSYLNWKFTGEYMTSESMVSGSGLYNIHQRDYDEQLLESIAVNRQQLPKIVKNNEVFPLLNEVADVLGVEAGIPVMATNPDGALNQIGAESQDGRVMTLSVGTSGAIRMSVEQANTSETGLWNYRSPRTWLIGTATSGACNCVDWFKEEFCENRYSYQELEAKIPQEKKADEQPIFLPFLFGERGPGWDMLRRGGFEAMHHQHRLGDFYYSILEGVLFNLYQGYEMLIRSVGEPKTIQLSGGILNSKIWMQMCADIFGKSMTINNTKDMSMLGAAKWTEKCLMDLDEKEQREINHENMKTKVIVPNMEYHHQYKVRYNMYFKYYRSHK